MYSPYRPINERGDLNKGVDLTRLVKEDNELIKPEDTHSSLPTTLVGLLLRTIGDTGYVFKSTKEKKTEYLKQKRDIALKTIYRALGFGSNRKKNQIIIPDELKNLKLVDFYLQKIISNKETIDSKVVAIKDYINNKGISDINYKYFKETDLGEAITMKVDRILVQIYTTRVSSMAKRWDKDKYHIIK